MCVWVEDADKLELDSKELGIVFENKAIASYLNSRSSLGLAGVKGQGKTFLIKVKRKRIEENVSRLCLPKNNMVDVLDSSFHIDRSLFNFLIDYNIWVDLWKYAICAAIISYPNFAEMYDLEKIGLKKGTIEILNMDNSNYAPTFYLKRMLCMNVHELKVTLEDTGRLFELIKEIRQSVYVFFDKLDQGFSRYAKNFNKDSRMPSRSRNASFWQYAQYSLAEASYDIFANTAHHIKILYTIRQEALIDAEFLNKDKVRNINSYITRLEYSKSDLKDMYRKYIANEEDKNLVEATCKLSEPSKAFVGVEELQHGYIPDTKENLFDYMYRHSFKRPYDIMKICRTLYFSANLTIKDIRHIVNKEANELLSLYLHELEIFLPCELTEIDRVIKMMTGNILNLRLMKAICDTFNFENSVDEVWQCNQECNHCASLQPFSILYNLGLIGYLHKHEADLYPYEEFRNIGNSILELNTHTLPCSEYYFMHPALSNKARDSRNEIGLSFEMNEIMLIGDGCEMQKDLEVKVKRFVRRCHRKFCKERIFISSTIFDLEEERKNVREYLKERGLHPIMSDHNDFNLSDTQQGHSHDCCIDEMIKCGSLIFILGREYGGVYKGDKYDMYKEEIIKYSHGKIKNPSISLMEYYIAQKKRIKCYAFVHKNIDDMNYRNALSDDMKNEIDFLNHFSVDGSKIRGNWISRYSSCADLLLLVKNIKFT